MIPTLPAFLLAALIALSGAAGVLMVVGGTTFPLGSTNVPFAYVVPPFVVLALFQLIFGSLSHRWRGLRFWAVALPVTVVVWGAGLILLLETYLTPMQALTGVASALIVAGLAALWAGRNG